MKRISRILILLPLVLWVSCLTKRETAVVTDKDKVPEQPTEPTQFEATLSEALFNASQTLLTVTVTCDMDWSAKLEDASWGAMGVVQKAADGHGGTVTVDLGFNTGKETRSNKVILTSGTAKLTKEFVQQGVDELVKPSALYLRGTQEGVLQFTPGMPWKVELADDSWLEAHPFEGAAGGPVSVSISAKEESVEKENRSGSVKIIFGGKYEVLVPVTQAGNDDLLNQTGRVIQLEDDLVEAEANVTQVSCILSADTYTWQVLHLPYGWGVSLLDIPYEQEIGETCHLCVKAITAAGEQFDLQMDARLIWKDRQLRWYRAVEEPEKYTFIIDNITR